MSENPLDREIMAMVRDARIAGVVKESIERLRDGHAGPEMARMARDLIEGRIRLRDIPRDPAFAEGFLLGLDRYQRWEAGLDAGQRRRFEDEVTEHVSSIPVRPPDNGALPGR